MLGYAVDDGQTAVGIRCVAAPLFNDRGCCGAIGVSISWVRTVRDHRGKALVEARAASARLVARGTAPVRTDALLLDRQLTMVPRDA